MIQKQTLETMYRSQVQVYIGRKDFMNTDKLCQSCAMPLNEKGVDLRGTELDGSKSTKYCIHCYQKGVFTMPSITLEGMIEKGIDGVEKSDANFLKKFLMKKSYPTLLKQLDRWK